MLKDLLIRHEGVRLKPYRCTAGKITIGIGRNLEDRGITLEEAYLLLENDIAQVRRQLAERLPWYLGLDEVRRAVLEDMTFNMGIGGLLNFRNMLRHVQAGKWEEAAKEMFDSRWAFQVGDGPEGREDRADRLAKMMVSGEWP